MRNLAQQIPGRMQGGNPENKHIQELIKGNASSFDEIYKIYYNKVYSFSYRYLQSKMDAEGVVQDTFITLWNKRETLAEIRNLNAWLFTVCFNLIRKTFRNMATEKRIMEKYAFSSILDSTTPLDTVEFNDLMDKADQIIDELPKRQKAVLTLSIKEGLSSTEISEKLNINKRTVENHLSSSRAFLKKVLREKHLIPLILYWFWF